MDLSDEMRLKLFREASSLELEFSQFRGVANPVAAHPQVVEVRPSRVVVEIRLVGEPKHAIQVDFYLRRSDEARAILLRYLVDDQEEIYYPREYQGSMIPTWFIPESLRHVALTLLSDTARMAVMEAHDWGRTQPARLAI